MEKAKLTNLRQKPKTLGDLNKNWMYRYIEKNGTEADREFYKKLVKDNIVKTEKGNDSLDIKVVRKEFAARFFPELLERKTVKKKQTYFELVDSL